MLDENIQITYFGKSRQTTLRQIQYNLKNMFAILVVQFNCLKFIKVRY